MFFSLLFDSVLSDDCSLFSIVLFALPPPPPKWFLNCLDSIGDPAAYSFSLIDYHQPSTAPCLPLCPPTPVMLFIKSTSFSHPSTLIPFQMLSRRNGKNASVKREMTKNEPPTAFTSVFRPFYSFIFMGFLCCCLSLLRILLSLSLEWGDRGRVAIKHNKFLAKCSKT